MTDINDSLVRPDPPIRILCVDDDPFMRRLLETMLGNLGFATRMADSARAALEILKAESIDLVITDQQMPRVSGLELLHIMREDGCQTPVIVLTGFGSIAEAVSAVRRGAAYYLSKPPEPQVLRQLIDDIVAAEREHPGGTAREVHEDGSLEGDDRGADDVQAIPATAPGDSEVLVLPGLDVSLAERELILRALERTRNNRAAAAKLLGMHVRTLRRKLKEMEIFDAIPKT